MSRVTLPKKIKDALLNEYDHRCAICGGDRPHIHHIDEDSSNNEIDNLLPLCPNCHLSDQHNPTRKIDVPKLKLFREFKDPSILKSGFHPIYTRQIFLDNVEINEDGYQELKKSATELVEFVSSLEMGDFYSKQINQLIMPRQGARVIWPGGSDYEYVQRTKSLNREYRQKLTDNKSKIQSLLVELLHYQSWASE